MGCRYELQTPHYYDYDDDDTIETGTSEFFIEKNNTYNTGSRASLVSSLLLYGHNVSGSCSKASLHTGLQILGAVQSPPTGDHAVDTKVTKLIAAVSADIIHSALSLRSDYLLASGMSEEAVALELEELSKSPPEQ